MKNNKIGLFFGSFNPIHIGHLAIANYLVEYYEIDQLWFVVSPCNPFKKKKKMLEDYHRVHLVQCAVENDPRFKVCDIELKLPKPSYTIDTLTYLHETYPDKEFYIIMGSDNLKSIDKWKNYEMIFENYPILVYPRPDYEVHVEDYPSARIQILKAPLMEISSSFIRRAVADGKDVRYFLFPEVFRYMDEMNFYKKPFQKKTD